jgi:hypothetical protein
LEFGHAGPVELFSLLQQFFQPVGRKCPFEDAVAPDIVLEAEIVSLLDLVHIVAVRSEQVVAG